MKANRKFKSDSSGTVYTAVVGGLVALMLTIVIGVMVYFEVTDGIDEFDEVTETFTGYTRYAYGGGTATGSNYTGVTIILANSPNSAADVNITCWNASGTSGAYGRVQQTHPTVRLNHRTITIAPSVGARSAGDTGNFTQVNITYTSHIAATETDDVTPLAQTVFTLLPIIALVVVAAIIIGIVVMFGGGGRRGGL